jgi:hypothetical protein
MIDRIGPAITLMSGTFVLAGQIIDQVNSTAEALAVLLFAAGVLVGGARALRASLRFASKVNDIMTLLEGLDQRLTHGDRRMGRIEEAVGLDPLAPLDGERRDPYTRQ